MAPLWPKARQRTYMLRGEPDETKPGHDVPGTATEESKYSSGLSGPKAA